MNNEKQRIAIAEACGIVSKDKWGPLYKTPHGIVRDCPDYLNDLNAMHEAEDGLFPQIYDRYVKEIAKRLPPYDSNTARFADLAVMNSTAAQRAEAFLRTIGKWEDDK